MDLSSIKPMERDLPLLHPATGAPTGLTLVVACAHDERVRDAMRSANDRFIAGGKKLDEIDEMAYDQALTAAHIIGVKWEGDATWNGETPPFSSKLAQEMCGLPWLQNAVKLEVRKIRDFYKA